MVALPPGVRVSFTVYMTSEDSGIDATVETGNGSAIPEDLAQLVDVLISTAGWPAGIDDFRPMTDEEITAYIKDQEENKNNE